MKIICLFHCVAACTNGATRIKAVAPDYTRALCLPQCQPQENLCEFYIRVSWIKEKKSESLLTLDPWIHIILILCEKWVVQLKHVCWSLRHSGHFEKIPRFLVWLGSWTSCFLHATPSFLCERATERQTMGIQIWGFLRCYLQNEQSKWRHFMEDEWEYF